MRYRRTKGTTTTPAARVAAVAAASSFHYTEQTPAGAKAAMAAAGEIPAHLPLVLDSPMATEATLLYRHHGALLRVPQRELRALSEGVRIVTTVQQSQRLAASRYPAVIISASGMATGGRVLHHLKSLAPNPRNHIAFAGFQVAGTRGAKLVAGDRAVKIHGEFVPVNAEVSQIESFSGHADANGLLQWMRAIRQPPRQVFVVHGEAAAADALRGQRITAAGAFQQRRRLAGDARTCGAQRMADGQAATVQVDRVLAQAQFADAGQGL